MNTAYIVCFDITNPNSRESMVQKIMAMGGKRLIPGSYIVLSEEVPVRLREQLAPDIDFCDKLFVGELGYRSAWDGYGDSFSMDLQELLSEKNIANRK